MRSSSPNSAASSGAYPIKPDLSGFRSLLPPQTNIISDLLDISNSELRGTQHTTFSMMTILVLLPILFCFTTLASRSKLIRKAWRECLFTKSSSKSATSPSSQGPEKHPKHSPYVFPRLQPKSSTHTSMGLRRLDMSNWLTIDSHYTSEHYERGEFLNSIKPDVIQCLPGSEDACREALSLVVDFLTDRFPEHFTLKGNIVYNHIVNESFDVSSRCLNPLEVAARLAMEDFNILVKNPETGEYHLQASATLYPAGWKLQERIGTTMANLHKPVPKWKEKLASSVNRYFDHLSAKTAMERLNLFVQTRPDLFIDAPEAEFDEENAGPRPMPATLQVRRERQTFRRLEKTDAVLFTVRTYMEPLAGLEEEEALAFIQQVQSWDEDIRAYKGWNAWGVAFTEWCEGRLKKAC